MAKHLLLLCPKWAADRQLHYSGDFADITHTRMLHGYENPVEFVISSGNLPPPPIKMLEINF